VCMLILYHWNRSDDDSVSTGNFPEQTSRQELLILSLRTDIHSVQ